MGKLNFATSEKGSDGAKSLGGSESQGMAFQGQKEKIYVY